MIIHGQVGKLNSKEDATDCLNGQAPLQNPSGEQPDEGHDESWNRGYSHLGPVFIRLQ